MMWASKQFDPADHASIIRDARDFALLNGLVLRYANMTNDNCVGHIPFALFPSPYPRRLYQECLDIQPTVNKLMFKIAADSDFINETLGPIAQVDSFTKDLLRVHNEIEREGVAQPMLCCINRSDYMLDKAIESNSSGLRVRQVEVNAIASSMAAHSCKVQSLHEFLLSKYKLMRPSGASTIKSNSLSLVVQGLIDAFDSYGERSALILLVTDKRSMNFSDQVMIEVELRRLRPDIGFVRRSFSDLEGQIKLGPNKELILDETKEIALVYLRNCYDPSNYNFPGAWPLRLLLERSRAIKCPSINFHLSGAKKFQQVLNNPTQLERFLSPEESDRLSKVFCKFWSFESNNPLAEEGLRMAMSSPKKLVLKPQREGGGHNIFGNDIKPFVERIVNTDELSQFILMEYIDGPLEKNWLLLFGDDPEKDSHRLEACDNLVSELGIFGSILADSRTSSVVFNESAGYLIRSKNFGVMEGGVASGYAGISSLVLLDDLEPEFDYSSYYENSWS